MTSTTKQYNNLTYSVLLSGILFLSYFGIDFMLTLGLAIHIPDGIVLKIYDIGRILLLILCCSFFAIYYRQIFRQIPCDTFIVCIILFWCIYGAHLLYDSYIQPGTQSQNSSVYGIIRSVGTLIRILFPIIILSIPLTSKQKNVVFYSIFFPLFLFCVIILIWFHSRILSGYAFPTASVLTKTLPFVWSWESLWEKIPDRFSLINFLITLQTVSFNGGLLACLTIWLWWRKKINLFFFCVIYTIGIICMYFGTSRGAIIACYGIHILFFLFIPFFQKNIFRKTTLFILLIHLFGLIFICYNSPQRFVLRFERLINEIFFAGKIIITPQNNEELINYKKIPIGNKMEQDHKNIPIQQEKKLLPNNNNNNNMSEEHEITLEYHPLTVEGISENTPNMMELQTAIDRIGSNRIKLIREALNLFYQSPIIGKQTYFLIKRPSQGLYNKKFHPHNLFAEALMSTGIVGTICLLYLLTKTCIEGIRLFRNHSDFGWLGILFFGSFFLSFFAIGCCYPILWFTMILIQINRYDKNINNDNIDEVLSPIKMKFEGEHKNYEH